MPNHARICTASSAIFCVSDNFPGTVCAGQMLARFTYSLPSFPPGGASGYLLLWPDGPALHSHKAESSMKIKQCFQNGWAERIATARSHILMFFSHSHTLLYFLGSPFLSLSLTHSTSKLGEEHAIWGFKVLAILDLFIYKHELPACYICLVHDALCFCCILVGGGGIVHTIVSWLYKTHHSLTSWSS